jgi:ABC exporter DevB family membrane fusion protein
MLAFDGSPRLDVEFSTLVEVLGERARNQPEQTAFIFLLGGETEAARLTYKELDRVSRAIAVKLQRMGATGKRALLLYPPGLDFIAAFFGCLYAGVVAVPAYPPRPNQSMSRLQAILASSEVAVALTTASLLVNIEGQLVHNPELAALRWLATDNLASNLGSDWEQPALCPNTLAFLQYTAGSTGRPKGVMASHGNLLHNLALSHQSFEYTSNSRGVIWLPSYNDMGLISGVLQPIYSGFPVTLMSPAAFLSKPFRWLQAISRYKATTSGGPNSAYELCVRKIKPEQLESLDLSSWEVAFNGAEPLRAETLDRFVATFESCGFRREAFYPCYGITEATLFVSGGLKTRPPTVYEVSGVALEQNQVVPASGEQKDTRKLVGLGRTWLDQKIVIVDPESLTECPFDQVGEIWVSGSSVAQGYWNRPEETAQTFHAYLADTDEGPFLRTGDLGFLHDGELFVTGRIKDLIVIEGRNHYPQDIELTVEIAHPALHPGGGAAFSVEIDAQEQLVIAQEVERSYLRHLDVDSVIRAIRQVVMEQHNLEVYAVLLLKPGSIPKTSSGKIQRHACRQGFTAGGLEVVNDFTQSPKDSTLDTNSWKDHSHDPARKLKPSETAEAIEAWIGSNIAQGLKSVSLLKRRGWQVTFLLLAALCASNIVIVYSFLRSHTTTQTSPTPLKSTTVNAVAGLGNLEPQGEVVQVSAPASGQTSRVDQLLVKVGDRVEAGQVVAILDSRDRLQAARDRAQKQVLVALARLAQVKAGAKEGEIDAQKAKIESLKAERRGQIVAQEATIKRLEAELQGQKSAQAATIKRLNSEWRNAKTECDRYQMLYKDGAVTASSRDSKCLEEKTAFDRVNEAESNLSRTVTTLEAQITEAKANLQRTGDTLQDQQAEAKATLEQTAEIRPVEVAVAQSELADAKAGVKQAQAELDVAYVRSPEAGKILKIHTWPGEIVSQKGIVELGQTKQMYVKAEVYETDISKVHLGQRATITSHGFVGKLHGTVDEIGLEIGRKDVLGTDPVADADARVVEVKIRLEPADSQRVAGLTNLETKFVIDTSPSQQIATKYDTIVQKND